MAYGELDFAVSLSPLTAFPLDKRSYFASLAEAQAAAATAKPVGSTESVYYIGETLCVVEDDHADFYMIQVGPTLEKISGMEILVDENQFAYVDGKLSLKGFADAVAGAIPTIAIVEGKNTITWTKPSGDTVEGLDARVSALEESVQKLDEAVGNSQDRTGLYGELDKKADKDQVYSKEETEQAIENSKLLRQKKVESKEQIDPSLEGADKYVYIVPKADGSGHEKYIVIDGQLELIGEENFIKSVAQEIFSVDEQGKLNLHAVPASIITG